MDEDLCGPADLRLWGKRPDRDGLIVESKSVGGLGPGLVLLFIEGYWKRHWEGVSCTSWEGELRGSACCLCRGKDGCFNDLVFTWNAETAFCVTVGDEAWANYGDICAASLRTTVRVDLSNSIWGVNCISWRNGPRSIIKWNSCRELLLPLDQRHILNRAFHNSRFQNLCSTNRISNLARWLSKGKTLEILSIKLNFSLSNIRSLSWIDLVNNWLFVVLESALKHMPVIAIYWNFKTDVSKISWAQTGLGDWADNFIPFLRCCVIWNSVHFALDFLVVFEPKALDLDLASAVAWTRSGVSTDDVVVSERLSVRSVVNSIKGHINRHRLDLTPASRWSAKNSRIVEELSTDVLWRDRLVNCSESAFELIRVAQVWELVSKYSDCSTASGRAWRRTYAIELCVLVVVEESSCVDVVDAILRDEKG